MEEKPAAELLPADRFAAVVRDAPLISIDLIVRPPDRSVLVGLRGNEPARGTWFVPGGSIRKSERLDHAFRRIAVSELGLDRPRTDAHFLGVWEHHYPTNFQGDDSFGTHYVVLAYELCIDARPDTLPDDQHAQYRWLPIDELLADDAVHDHVKAYFR